MTEDLFARKEPKKKPCQPGASSSREDSGQLQEHALVEGRGSGTPKKEASQVPGSALPSQPTYPGVPAVMGRQLSCSVLGPMPTVPLPP